MFAGWLLPQRFKCVLLLISVPGVGFHDVFPSYSSEPPFDRHDWVIRRPSTGEEVRYVIDYYSAPPLPDGSPVFSLDVRPALDSVGSISERIKAATRETWEEFSKSSSIRGAVNSSSS